MILDRDGVLNREPPDGGYLKNWSEWRWLPGALEGLQLLHAVGIRVSVATNQAGVGRGIMDRADLDAIHAHMLDEATRAGGAIEQVWVCPHAPETGCDCRKPAPGLLVQAIEASGVPRTATLAVGDDLRDLQAAWAAHVSSVLVRTGKGRLTEKIVAAQRVPAFADLLAFAVAVSSHSIRQAGAFS
ncbi:MAG: D-glycero-alpha-D-manno-heptose-1,7-bisphosphate 7-phosphatase [Rhodanobacteraceae bacterium]